jgi:hypothetical protein
MGDNLPELLYTEWRKNLPDPTSVPSWGNAPTEQRLAWEAAAVVARKHVQVQCAAQVTSEYDRQRDAEYAIRVCSKQWSLKL